MAKRIFFDTRGRLKILPWGFHLVEDLVPFYKMTDDLKRNNLSQTSQFKASMNGLLSKDQECLFDLSTLWYFKTTLLLLAKDIIL